MKVQNRPGNGYSTAHTLKPYCDPPTALAKEKLQRSTISFQELMQIQIERVHARGRGDWRQGIGLGIAALTEGYGWCGRDC
jgi:hypothetical protein